jgi:AcrR family transcriptional regulator
MKNMVMSIYKMNLNSISIIIKNFKEDFNLSNIDSNKNIKRKRLIDAAAKVMSNKGYNESSIKDITDEAKVSVGSFYSYFSNKEEILLSLYDDIAEMHFQIAKIVGNNCEPSGAKRLASIISSIVWFQYKNPQLVLILLLKTISINEKFENKYKEIINNVKDVIIPIFEKMKLNNLIKSDDVEISATAFIYSINGVMLSEIMNNSNKDIASIAFNIVSYNLNGLKMKFNEEDIKSYIKELFSNDYFETIINEEV